MYNVFFEVFASDIPACQEILRTIIEDDDLIVNDVIVQSSERNIYGRSVRLDALCTYQRKTFSKVGLRLITLIKSFVKIM